MKFDYIGDTFLTLTQQKRVKDAKDFCERVIAEAPSMEFRCMARLNLVNLYYHAIGDGPAARAVCLEAWADFEKYPDLMENSKNTSPEVMKSLYCELCAWLRDLSLNFDEYEAYQLKKEKHQSTPKEKSTTKQAEKIYRHEGVPWIENILSMAGDAWQHGAFSQSAVYLSLALEFKRELKTGREDLNTHILKFYPQAIIIIISKNINECLDRRQETRLENYEFIATSAITRIKDCENSRLVDSSMVENGINSIQTFLAEIRSKIQRGEYRGASPHPTNAEIDLNFRHEMEKLKISYLRIRETDTHSGNHEDPPPPVPQGKIPPGCKILMILVLLGVAGYYWYDALITKSHGVLSWVLAIICSLLFLNSIIAALKNKKK